MHSTPAPHFLGTRRQGIVQLLGRGCGRCADAATRQREAGHAPEQDMNRNPVVRNPLQAT
jgi:hypothetical protein